MATFGIIHQYRGATEEQYEVARRAVHPEGGLPDGQLHHIAGTTDDGFVVIALWDSEAAWDKFRDDTLMPALPTLEGGPPNPPTETRFHIFRNQTA